MDIKYKFLLFIILLICFIPSVSSYQITSDATTESSIVWNLTDLSSINISSIAFDGILITDYEPHVSYLIQNNLYPDELHIITVISDTDEKYEGRAYTVKSEQNVFYTFINQYILILLVLIVFLIAIFTEPFIGFIGIIIAFIGLTTTINYSFELGSIFVILMIAGFFISVRDK